MAHKPIQFSGHARFEMKRRGISCALAEATIRAPGQVVPSVKGRDSEAGHATANIGLIWGRAANPFALLGNLKNLAKCNGATTLRIVADFSDDLAPVAIRRYGFVQLGNDGKYVLDIIL